MQQNYGKALIGAVVSIGLLSWSFGYPIFSRFGKVEVLVEQPETFRESVTLILKSDQTKRTYESNPRHGHKFNMVRPGEYELNVRGIDGKLLPFASKLSSYQPGTPNSGVSAPIVTVKKDNTSSLTIDIIGQLAPHREATIQLFLDGVCYPKQFFQIGAHYSKQQSGPTKETTWHRGSMLSDGKIEHLLFDALPYTHLEYDGGYHPIKIPQEGTDLKVHIPTGSIRVALPSELEIPDRTNIQVLLTPLTENGPGDNIARFSHWFHAPKKKTTKDGSIEEKALAELTEWNSAKNELVIHGALPGNYRADLSVTHQTMALGGWSGGSASGAKRKKLSQKVDMSKLHKELFESKTELTVEVSKTTDWDLN